ncbi:helix-turn-helix domain-containing protein [Williamsia sp.]|uniref:helix-turn-helix domain-containing protein n=1 Tax=Williamsia sp. TaxID=1872085 RepID=UPI001A1E8A0C|nr:helix-turn-helix domain-containing protein [Williamsia sp.]MBJ7287587.1 helix-turn-helix domain-containing protein [Williamsia sp.]
MSWKAVDWATDAKVGSPVLKLILILLANKADEQFSCFPSVRTLMAESGAGRSTVLRALKTLETDGLITRRAQFHASGAQRSSRYYLNHPDVQLSPEGVDTTLPRPESGRGLSRRRTEGVPIRHPPGDPQVDPLNPPKEPPSEPSTRSAKLFDALPAPWTVGRADRRRLGPAIDGALESGWTASALTEHLSRNPHGVRSPVRVLEKRLADLPSPPSGGRESARRLPWCGDCEDEQSRTMTVVDESGCETAAFCPRCSPQSERTRNPRTE